MTTKIPKVAVITRTKDRGILLERAIQSVHSQTMGDFIHVIFNDAGDKKVVDDLVEKYADIIQGRVKVVHNPQSRGLSAALNGAIEATNSEYIAVHDDDDSWHKDFLKLTTELLDEKKADGVITVVDIVEEKIEGDKVVKIKQGRGLEPVRGVVSLYEQCLANYATPITFVYRRASAEKTGFYSEDFEVAEDWDFTLRFLMEYDIHSLITDEALAYYHHRSSSTGSQLNSIFIDGGAKFDYHINKIANYHLRKEIKSGSLGLGYIISSIRHDRDFMRKLSDDLNGRINESVKTELHYVADGIKDVVKAESLDVKKTVTDGSIKHSLTRIIKSRD